MKTVLALGVLVGGLVAALPSRAESLRCSGGIASEGDSRLSLVHKCGQPLLRDSFCAAIFYGDTGYQVPESIALRVAPCIPTEEWLYDRGAGNLMATVRLRSGKIESIRYGSAPR